MLRLLVAGATWSGGHELVQMSHTWRRNVNSFFTTNGESYGVLRRVDHAEFGTSEVWASHPDFVAAECRGCCVNASSGTCAPHPDWREHKDTCPNPTHCGWCGQTGNGCRFHEQRYVVTPSLANQTFFPNYDWLLYADAETIWFRDAVVDMVKGLDPAEPWYFSESMFPGSKATCVFPGREPIVKDGCVHSPAPNPTCTPKTILDAKNCAWKDAPDKDGRANPRPPGQVWNGGNWGLMVSRGTMARITPEQWLDCVECRNEFHGCYGGGDCRLGECIWRHGVAPTLPDRDYNVSGIEGYRLGELPADAFISFLQSHKTECNDTCRKRVQHPLSLNVRNKKEMAQLEVALFDLKKLL